MTKEEYDNRKAELEAAHRKAMKGLITEYAIANNPVEIGDIVIDHCQSIKVQEIFTAPPSLGIPPQCFYKGPLLTKKMVPFKSGEWSGVYQTNMKTHIKKADIKAKG